MYHPPHSCAEALTPSVLVYGDGAFGRQLGQVRRVFPRDGISSLVRAGELRKALSGHSEKEGI